MTSDGRTAGLRSTTESSDSRGSRVDPDGSRTTTPESDSTTTTPDVNPEDVTLAVPCYNVADTVSRALSAIERLEPGPATVVCVDDGSTDGTKAIVEAYDGVRLIEHDRNRGLGTTLNTALSSAETTLFAKVDADIVVPPDWLAVMCRELEESGAAFVQGRFVEEITTRADRWRDEYPSPSLPDEPRRNKPLNGSNIIADVAALRDVGGWDEQFRRAFDDIDVMERLVEAGYDVYYTPAVETTHVRTDTIREVLHTAWAYHNDPSLRGTPVTFLDVFRRFPEHAYLSGRSVLSETRRGRYSLAVISFLRLFFHVYWDVAHVRSRDQGARAMGDSRGFGDAVSRWVERLRFELSTRVLSENVVVYDGVLLDLASTVFSYELYRVMADGWYERQEATFVRRYLPADVDVIELGAGIGYVSAIVDEHLDGDQLHVAVEPNPAVLPVLERTRELNDGRWIPHEAAYHPTATSVELDLSADYWDSTTGRSEGGPDEVSAISLESLCTRYDLPVFTLVLDVEGAEYDLLTEELDLLVERCPLLIVEFHEFGPAAAEYDDDLVDAGFELLAGWDDVAVYRNTVLDW